jgi:hypothetical protein
VTPPAAVSSLWSGHSEKSGMFVFRLKFMYESIHTCKYFVC